MCDHVIPPPEPGRGSSGIDADPVSEAIAALSELTAAGVEVDGEIQVTESIWAIYGHTSYDGEILVGEYDAAEASEVLRAAPRRRPDHEGPIP
jgi:hypothetical protein